MASKHGPETGCVLLSDLKDQLQKEYLEERRHELLPALAPGREVLVAAEEAAKTRGWRRAVGDLSCDVESLFVGETSPRSQSSRHATIPQLAKPKQTANAGSVGVQKFKRTVTHMRSCMRVVKAFSRRQHLEIRVQDNLVRRHIYGAAKEVLDDCYSSKGNCHSILDVFQAITCATRQVLIMRRVCEVLGAYLAERRARVSLTKIAQDHLKIADWDVFEHNLKNLRDDMETSRVQFDGMADIGTYANIVHMMLDDIAKHRHIRTFEADRYIRNFEFRIDMSKQTLHDAEYLVVSAQDGIENMKRLLTFLGGCTGRRIAAADELSGFQSIKAKEEKIMADLPEDTLTKIKGWLDDFHDDIENDKLCKNELLKIGVERGDVQLIISAVRRERALENVKPIMTQYSSALIEKLEELREHLANARQGDVNRSSVEDERKSHRHNAEKLWDDLIASFQPPSLLTQASRLTSCGLKKAMEDGLSKDTSSLSIEYKRCRSVTEVKRRLSAVAADALIKYNFRCSSRRHSTLAVDAEGLPCDMHPLSSEPEEIHPSNHSENPESALKSLREDPAVPMSNFSVTPVSEHGGQISIKKICIAGYDENVDGIYTESEEICNGFRTWLRSDLAMVIYSNEHGRWAVASPGGMQCNSSFLVTEVHGGDPPSGKSWYSSRVGEYALLDGVTSYPYFDADGDFTAGPHSQRSRTHHDATETRSCAHLDANIKTFSGIDIEASEISNDMNVSGRVCFSADAGVTKDDDAIEFGTSDKMQLNYKSVRGLQRLNEVRQNLRDSPEPIDRAAGVGAQDHWFSNRPDQEDPRCPEQQDACSESSVESQLDSSRKNSQPDVQHWYQRYEPLDSVVASRLNLRVGTPAAKPHSMSPRRRPCHIFKERANVESVMFDRNRRGHIHGRVLLDPWNLDEKRVQLRKFETCW